MVLKRPVVPPAVVKLWLTPNAWLLALRNVHVAVLGGKDSAAPKSTTGSVLPGFTPRRMIMRSTGIADASVKSLFRAAKRSSAPDGRLSSVKLPFPFAEPNHHPIDASETRCPVTPPND